MKNSGAFILFLFATSFLFAQQKTTLTLGKPSDTQISRNIYGQFAEHLGRSIYDGIYKDGKIRMDIVEALRKIQVPNLRWPGGCFADQYHWKDGIGPKSARPKTVNTTWGMVTEDNSFGTHEFLEFCSLINCEPYIAGNVGTGSPQEMESWLEYLNFNGNSSLTDLRKQNVHPEPFHVSLWGVGNESWGCGGDMTPEYYAGLYKQYASFCPSYPGSPLKKIMSGANGDDYHWTEIVMKNVSPDEAWGYSMHYYTFPTGGWNPRGSATSFTESEYAHTLKGALRIEEIIEKHSAIMDKYDPQKKIALLVDEWGVWTDVEPGTNRAFMFQQNSLRDALVAASTLNIFNNHCERVKGANLAQMVNVIHSLILTQGDRMILTPTYFVFELYKVHQDAKWIPVAINGPLYINCTDTVKAVNASASMDSSGRIHISLVNLDPEKNISITTTIGAKTITGQILSSGKITDINSFDKPGNIGIKPFTGFIQKGNELTISLPAKSIVVLEIN